MMILAIVALAVSCFALGYRLGTNHALSVARSWEDMYYSACQRADLWRGDR